MVLSREAYRALEEIVGPEHVSEDSAVLDSQIYQWFAEFHGELGNKFMPHRSEAGFVLEAPKKSKRSFEPVTNSG